MVFSGQASSVLLAIAIISLTGAGSCFCQDEVDNAHLLHELQLSSKLDNNNPFVQFLPHLPVSEDYNVEGGVPDINLERYFVAIDGQSYRCFFHQKSRLTILNSKNGFLRIAISTSNPHEQKGKPLSLNAIITFDAKERKILSLIVPASLMELRYDSGTYRVIYYKEARSIDLKAADKSSDR